jgi:hypothetical protein
LKVLVTKASNLDYKRIMEFDSAEKLLDYMKRSFHSWIVRFQTGLEEEEYDVEAILYDDYVE